MYDTTRLIPFSDKHLIHYLCTYASIYDKHWFYLCTYHLLIHFYYWPNPSKCKGQMALGILSSELPSCLDYKWGLHMSQVVFQMPTIINSEFCYHILIIMSGWLLLIRADSRLAPSQWEKSLESNDVCHWQGADLESALLMSFTNNVRLSLQDPGIISVFHCIAVGSFVIMIRQSHKQFVCLYEVVGGILVTLCPSVCPSVRPSHIPCPLCGLQFSLDPFHIYTSYKATSESVSHIKFLTKFKIWILTFVFNLQLWLCLFLTWELMWITSIGNQWVAVDFSERIHSSCSSL